MSFEMPIIILLLAANVLWFIVGWAMGYKEALEDQDFRETQDAR
jgi:hypothetical protein